MLDRRAVKGQPRPLEPISSISVIAPTFDMRPGLGDEVKIFSLIGQWNLQCCDSTLVPKY